MELNPNHPTTQTLRDHWHKIAILIMRKLGVEHVIITEKDIERLAEHEGSYVFAHDQRDGLHIRLVSREEGERLAREHGGLPT